MKPICTEKDLFYSILLDKCSPLFKHYDERQLSHKFGGLISLLKRTHLALLNNKWSNPSHPIL